MPPAPEPRNDAPPQIAAIHYDKDAPLDALFADIVATLAAGGAHLAGVQQVVAVPGTVCATMQGIDIVDIESGRRFPVWDQGGPLAEGCRLDERGLIAAAPLLEQSIERGVDLVIVNRFGRAEPRGGGLLSVIGKAIEAGIPVLTAVRRPYDRAWSEFHGGLADDLPASREAVVAWCRRAIRPSAPAAGDRIGAGIAVG